MIKEVAMKWGGGRDIIKRSAAHEIGKMERNRMLDSKCCGGRGTDKTAEESNPNQVDSAGLFEAISTTQPDAEVTFWQ